MSVRGIDLSIVVPVFNEAETIQAFYRETTRVLAAMGCSYEILMIDDGSTDDSFARIVRLAKADRAVRGISFSRNFGHQAALSAGLESALGDAVVTMDADLQHPPGLIPKLYEQHLGGYDIAYTVREDDRGSGVLKRATSSAYYRLINRLSSVRIEPTAADFRLMSRRAVDAFLQFSERGRFIRGLVSWMGFSQVAVPYRSQPRYAGASKYTVGRMLRLGLDGITAFSSRPLHLSFFIGVLVSLFAFGWAVYALVMHFSGRTLVGWTSLILAMLFLGGIQLVSIGILGLYLARVFEEVKCRPLYLIARRTPNREASAASLRSAVRGRKRGFG